MNPPVVPGYRTRVLSENHRRSPGDSFSNTAADAVPLPPCTSTVHRHSIIGAAGDFTSPISSNSMAASSTVRSTSMGGWDETLSRESTGVGRLQQRGIALYFSGSCTGPSGFPQELTAARGFIQYRAAPLDSLLSSY